MNDIEYTSVPVPNHLVMDVMRMITEDASRHRGPATPSHRRVEVHDTSESRESRAWTRSELQVIWDNMDKPSVAKFGKVLSLLADRSPDSMAKTEIGNTLGIEFLRLQNSLGRFTKFIENRLGDARWPLVMTVDTWGISEETASLWKSISSSE